MWRNHTDQWDPAEETGMEREAGAGFCVCVCMCVCQAQNVKQFSHWVTRGHSFDVGVKLWHWTQWWNFWCQPQTYHFWSTFTQNLFCLVSSFCWGGVGWLPGYTGSGFKLSSSQCSEGGKGIYGLDCCGVLWFGACESNYGMRGNVSTNYGTNPQWWVVTE